MPKSKMPPKINSNIGNASRPKQSQFAQPIGRLQFEVNFDSGNLERAEQIGQDEYNLYIRADTCASQYRCWFYFAVWNASPLQAPVTTFNVVNFSKPLSMFETNSAAPVFRFCPEKAKDDSIQWKRIPAESISYHSYNNLEQCFVLSFGCKFRRNDGNANDATGKWEFAYSIPYTFDRLRHFLNELESKQRQFIRISPLTLSMQKRRVDILSIGSATAEGRNGDGATRSGQKRPVVFICARVHPGESPSSWVMQGLIEFLAGADERAQMLRSLFLFKLIPMLNPDGVALGNYRCSLAGFDLNRQWLNPSPWAHPTISASKAVLSQLASNPRLEPVLCLDLHAHSQLPNAFLVGNSMGDMANWKRQLLLPFLLAELATDFSLQLTQFDANPKKAGTFRRAMAQLMGPNCFCYTLEVSSFCFQPNANANSGFIAYTEETYKLLGQNLALAILKFAKVLLGDNGTELLSMETCVAKQVVRQFRRKIAESKEPLESSIYDCRMRGRTQFGVSKNELRTMRRDRSGSGSRRRRQTGTTAPKEARTDGKSWGASHRMKSACR